MKKFAPKIFLLLVLFSVLVSLPFARAQIQYQLTISVTGLGTTRPAPGVRTYDEGSAVSVDARPAPDWMLDHWLLDGVDVGSDDPYTVTMDDDHTLTAVFTRIQYQLTISVTGLGTTDPSPGSQMYNEGTDVSVDAQPASGWQLDHWLLDGVDVGSDDPYTVTMDDDHTLTAVFVDISPPTISILSPENKTYAAKDIPLSFTVSETTSWIGYSLDGQTNVTVGGNTTLIGLSDGVHYITVHVNDTAGNMGSSDIVYFTVDTVSVSIDLLSPQNKTYATDSVSLSFEVDEETSWIGYSLDGQANNTITGDTTLIELSDGTHSLVVYASDMFGNTGSSDPVYFTVDTVLPNIEVLSPENKTYAVADVPLVFTLSGATSWMGYSLNGQMNVTVGGNITLVGLSDGVHTITVYANDNAGNVGHSDTVYFTINALPPNIEVFSPENKTYTTNSVSLSFTVNEPTLWMGYSLDGQANVTVFGDITLSGLSEGSHSLAVYARDLAGNTGASGVVYFAVETQQLEPSQLWVVAVIAIVAGAGFALTGYMAYDLFKRAKSEI